MPIRPNRYDFLDEVVSVFNGLKVRGFVQKVFMPSEFESKIKHLIPVGVEEEYKRRDKDYHKFAFYRIKSESCGGPATFDEAKIICPSITREQYNLIVGKFRYFIFADSDLVLAADYDSIAPHFKGKE